LSLVGNAAAIAGFIGNTVIRMQQAHAIGIIVQHRRWQHDHQVAAGSNHRAYWQCVRRTAAFAIVERPAGKINAC